MSKRGGQEDTLEGTDAGCGSTGRPLGDTLDPTGSVLRGQGAELTKEPRPERRSGHPPR